MVLIYRQIDRTVYNMQRKQTNVLVYRYGAVDRCAATAAGIVRLQPVGVRILFHSINFYCCATSFVFFTCCDALLYKSIYILVSQTSS